MLPAETYLEARRTARFHAQLRLSGVILPARLPGVARVDADVCRVFRGDVALQHVGRASFDVAVYDEAGSIEPGPEIRLPVSALVEGRVLEAFLNGDPPLCELASWQVKPIPAPTERAVMSDSVLD